jgi:hypothetical protein
MPLVVETGTGRNPAANSYASREFAAAFHADGVDAEAWAFVDPPDQDRALVTATRRLDGAMLWRGRPALPDQPLGWPRVGVAAPGLLVFSSAAVPAAVRQATAALALKVARDQAAALEAEAAGAATTSADTEQQVQEITLGPIGIKMAAASAETVAAQAAVAAKASRAVPQEVVAMLRHWGDYLGAGAALGRTSRG